MQSIHQQWKALINSRPPMTVNNWNGYCWQSESLFSTHPQHIYIHVHVHVYICPACDEKGATTKRWNRALAVRSPQAEIVLYAQSWKRSRAMWGLFSKFGCYFLCEWLGIPLQIVWGAPSLTYIHTCTCTCIFTFKWYVISVREMPCTARQHIYEGLMWELTYSHIICLCTSSYLYMYIYVHLNLPYNFTSGWY